MLLLVIQGAPESLPWGVEEVGEDVGTRGGVLGSLTFKKLAKEENSQVLWGSAGSQEQSGPRGPFWRLKEPELSHLDVPHRGAERQPPL